MRTRQPIIRRIATFVPFALLAGLLGACGGDDGPPVGTFVGAVADRPDTYIAVVAGEDRIDAYLCDDTGVRQSFAGERDGDRIVLTAGDDASLNAEIDDGAMTGTVVLPGSDEELAFAAEPATGDAGLYRAVEQEIDGISYTAGWVVDNDGEQRGAFTFFLSLFPPSSPIGAIVNVVTQLLNRFVPTFQALLNLQPPPFLPPQQQAFLRAMVMTGRTLAETIQQRATDIVNNLVATYRNDIIALLDRIEQERLNMAPYLRQALTNFGTLDDRLADAIRRARELLASGASGQRLLDVVAEVTAHTVNLIGGIPQPAPVVDTVAGSAELVEVPSPGELRAEVIELRRGARRGS